MGSVSELPLLIAGGDIDPNISALSAAARRAGRPSVQLLFGRDSSPALTWDLDSGLCLVNGEPLECGAAFVRHDVFTALGDGRPSSQHRALAWHTALTGWLASRPNIQVFNRAGLSRQTNKALVLHLARSVGLTIPRTVVTNDLAYLDEWGTGRDLAVKPVNGGGFCEDFREVSARTEVRRGCAAAPAIAQFRLVQPEVRVYAVGRRYFAFNVISGELDYRTTRDCRVEYTEDVPAALTSSLGRLLGLMELDFVAADFKTCPDVGELLFLEVNTAPMFVAFDRACGGLLCDAIVETLGQRVAAAPGA